MVVCISRCCFACVFLHAFLFLSVRVLQRKVKPNKQKGINHNLDYLLLETILLMFLPFTSINSNYSLKPAVKSVQ